MNRKFRNIRESLNQMDNYQIFKEDPAPWSWCSAPEAYYRSYF